MASLRKILNYNAPADFRNWLQADLQAPEIEVRFTPKSRHFEAHAGLPLLTHFGHLGSMDSAITRHRNSYAHLEGKGQIDR